MKRTVTLGLIQMSCESDTEQNTKKAYERIRQAAHQGANLVCTQELFRSRYFCQRTDSSLFSLAENFDEANETIRNLSELASDLEIVIIASLFEKQAAGIYYNTAVVIDADGRYLGKYRKMHIPEDPHFHEKFYFIPGDLGYRVFRTRYADIGVLICWDQWFPEAARLTAMRGAEIIFYPSAIAYTPTEKEIGDHATRDAWLTVQRGHAVSNGCFIATVNRVGFEGNPDRKDGLDFWGQSFVADPYGRIMKEASDEQEEILLCTIDLSFIDESRNFLLHFFRDRRIDSYDDLTKRFLNSED